MRKENKISVIIPVLNEEQAIGKVLNDIPGWVDEIIVVDNGSEDNSADVARSKGAEVFIEPERGYGRSCLTGISKLDAPHLVVFLDGDYSDRPAEMSSLVDPIIDNQADLVIGSRILGNCDKGSLSVQQRFGNWLACTLIHLFWGKKYTDLGPFRSIRSSILSEFHMSDKNYGWTVEMQLKAVRFGIKTLDVPVSYHKRIGKSKISGTLKGTLCAGTKILFMIFKELFKGKNGDKKR